MTSQRLSVNEQDASGSRSIGNDTYRAPEPRARITYQSRRLPLESFLTPSTNDIEMQRASAAIEDIRTASATASTASETNQNLNRSTVRTCSYSRRPGQNRSDVEAVLSCANGYPRLAAFMASSQDLMIFRRFSYVHIRLILHLQTEIADLESELDTLDASDDHENDDGSVRFRLRCWGVDKTMCEEEGESGVRTKKAVLDELSAKMARYDDLLLRMHQKQALQAATSHDSMLIRTYTSYGSALVEREKSWVYCEEDLVSLRYGRENSAFDGHSQTFLGIVDCRLARWLFRTPELNAKTGGLLYYYSAERIAIAVNLVISVVIVLLLAAPILGLYKLSKQKTERAAYASIGVLMLFTVVFAATLSILTKAGRHDLFAATAAYCAVLVVFIGSTQS